MQNPADSAQMPAPGYFLPWPLVHEPSPSPPVHGLMVLPQAAPADPGVVPVQCSYSQTDSFTDLHRTPSWHAYRAKYTLNIGAIALQPWRQFQLVTKLGHCFINPKTCPARPQPANLPTGLIGLNPLE